MQPNKPLNLPPIEERVEKLIRLVAETVRPCKACGVMIAMVRHSNGRLAPYTLDAINHFANCEFADQFRRKKKEVSE